MSKYYCIGCEEKKTYGEYEVSVVGHVEYQSCNRCGDHLMDLSRAEIPSNQVIDMAEIISEKVDILYFIINKTCTDESMRADAINSLSDIQVALSGIYTGGISGDYVRAQSKSMINHYGDNPSDDLKHN